MGSEEKLEPDAAQKASCDQGELDAFARGKRVDRKKVAGNGYVCIQIGSDHVIIDEKTMLVLIIEVGHRGFIDRDWEMGVFEKTVIDGQSFVLVPEDEFEDIIDTIRANEIMARIAAGEETWPAELVYDLFETDSRIRTYRTYRRMSGSELAEAAGISEGHLSEIERDNESGTVGVLRRIAAALRVDLEDLVV